MLHPPFSPITRAIPPCRVFFTGIERDSYGWRLLREFSPAALFGVGQPKDWPRLSGSEVRQSCESRSLVESRQAAIATCLSGGLAGGMVSDHQNKPRRTLVDYLSQVCILEARQTPLFSAYRIKTAAAEDLQCKGIRFLDKISDSSSVYETASGAGSAGVSADSDGPDVGA